jgi:shikimate dehydrogenase
VCRLRKALLPAGGAAVTDRYAVVGNPVEHSLSPAIHAEFARATGEDIHYGRILAAPDGFRDAVTRFRDGGGRGLNVTLPFKREAWELADTRAGYAQAAQAANTLTFGRDGIVGHNTDGTGLVRDLVSNLGLKIRGLRVLVMGAGGATCGVMEPIARERPQALVVANRTVEKAVALVAQFAALQAFVPGAIAARPYAALAGAQFDLVVNATSAGLSGAMPPLPGDLFAPGALAYDMVYGRRTPFMAFAAARGARVADGLGMLVEQAAESFFIWRGVRPATHPVIDLLRKHEP